jgi:hypothetical protein
MTTTRKLWRALSRRLANTVGPRNPYRRCSVQAPHNGPLIAVAGEGSHATMMCVSHAMAWAESDLCRDWAANNSSVSRDALSAWIAAGSSARPA